MDGGQIDTLIVHDHGIRNILRLDPGKQTASMGRLNAVTALENVQVNQIGLAGGLHFLEGLIRQPEPG